MGNSVIRGKNLDYSQTIDKLVDPASGQSVMGRFELYPLWRTKVKGNPPYDPDLAEAMLARHRYRRRRCNQAMQPVLRKCAAFFLADRVHFRGYKINHWFSYRELLEYHRCFPLGNVFVLFTIDRKSFARSYMSFECVDASDAVRLEEFFRQILADPQRIIETKPQPNDAISVNLIRPHWTYRDETGYYDLMREKEQSLAYSGSQSWNSEDDDELSESEHFYEVANGYRGRTVDHYQRHSASIGGGSNSEPSIPSLVSSHVYGLTPEEVANLPVARRVFVQH